MEIGGFFPYKSGEVQDNHYVERMCPGAEDTAHLMSGRCAIYYCVQDIMLSDKKKVAYLPAYDCETVLNCFVKAGYTIYYYDFDEKMVPQFEEEMIDKISLFLITGYYGYSTFDTEYVKRCKEKGVTILQDTTHTAFSPTGACTEADYVAVSLRKWMGVTSGGLAIKRAGKFQIEPVASDEVHLKLRDKALAMRQKYEECGSEEYNDEGNEAFWKAEFMLREIFDMQKGDERSLEAIRHFDLDEAICKRQENYRYLLEHFPQGKSFHPVFDELSEDVCPMFFAMYCEDREDFMEYLAKNRVVPKIYWPVPPCVEVSEYAGASYIYAHVMSISCDERFGKEEMKKVIKVLEEYRK